MPSKESPLPDYRVRIYREKDALPAMDLYAESFSLITDEHGVRYARIVTCVYTTIQINIKNIDSIQFVQDTIIICLMGNTLT